jgi:hypothetical protein
MGGALVLLTGEERAELGLRESRNVAMESSKSRKKKRPSKLEYKD